MSMCKHNGEFDDPMTGKCVICADDPIPKEEYVGRGTPEHKVQKFGNKTRWRADANVGLRKIDKLISLSRSLISELTELGIGPINVGLVSQATCTLDVSGTQCSFTPDGNLTVVVWGCDVRLIENAKSFSVGVMAKMIKAHLEKSTKVKIAS